MKYFIFYFKNLKYESGIYECTCGIKKLEIFLKMLRLSLFYLFRKDYN